MAFRLLFDGSANVALGDVTKTELAENFRGIGVEWVPPFVTFDGMT